MKWPGVANVEISLVTIFKGNWDKIIILDSKETKEINSYLDDQGFLGSPYKLIENENQSFQGTIVLGDGFVLSKEEAKNLIRKDKRNKDVIFEYQNGSELNSNVQQEPGRYVINFFDWPIEKAIQYEACFNKVLNEVKPERKKLDPNKNNANKRRNQYWWLFGGDAKSLYQNIKPLARCFRISTGGTKYVVFAASEKPIVYANTVAIIAKENFSDFAILNNSLYDQWAWKYCAIKGGATLRYAPSSAFETYPFPILSNKFKSKLETLGKNYHEFRAKLMVKIQLGLTKTYNQLHNKELIQEVEQLSSKEFQKKYGKETWNLYNHLEVKNEGNISFEEAVPLIFELRELHKEMDEAVLEAYGWHTDTERWGKAINLRHDFYELDYLPENDRVRYTIHSEARKEVLKRLLLLNHEMHEAEERGISYEELDVEKTLEIYKGHIKDWLPANNSLHAKTLKFLSSAQELLPTLGSSTAQSYKPFVNQYCSALENELQQKIFVAFNEHFQSQWIGKVEERNSYLKEQMALAHKGSMLFKALKFNSDKYTLGNMHFFLNLIWNENSNTVKASPLIQDFKNFAFKHYSDKFINKEVAAKLSAFIKKFRNESAHTGEVDKNMAVECMAEVRKFFKLLVESEIIEEKIVEAKPVKKKTRKSKSKEAKGLLNSGQATLFETPNLFNQDSLIGFESKVTIQKKDGASFKYHISKNAVKGKFTGEYKQITPSSSLAENMFGRKVGHSFLFGGLEYKILKLE